MTKMFREKATPAILSGLVLAGLVAGLSVARAAQVTGSITSQLVFGSRGDNVIRLQQVLATNASIYPEGLVTGYFGALTRSAVMRFQTSVELPPVGRVGPLTLARLNTIIASGGVISNGMSTAAPVISNVQASVGTNMATVTWTTNKPSNSRVYVGTTPLVMSEVSTERTQPTISGTLYTGAESVTSHTVTLPNLTAGTLYYYAVVSADAQGNVSMTWPSTFLGR